MTEFFLCEDCRSVISIHEVLLDQENNEICPVCRSSNMKQIEKLEYKLRSGFKKIYGE